MAEIFWVIAPSTDAGKTTVAMGLLRALTELGKSSMGFKPTAAENMLTSFDDMEKYPNGKLYGHDATCLLEASSAVGEVEKEALTEVVSPNKSVFFGTYKSIFMLRTGAPSQGYGQFCHVKNEANVLGRPDVREFLKRKELLDKVILKPPVDYSFIQAHKYFSENINISLERLSEYQPDAFVFEGASVYLPVWQGCPLPDHIVVVNGGVVEIITGIDKRIQQSQQGKRAPRTQDLYKLGSSIAKNSFQIEMPLALSDQRNGVMTATLKKLLVKSGIHG